MFSSVLIANRGEIACRVAQTARRMGLRVIAVYSTADANARHVKLADQAIEIGPASVRESYLRIDRIIAAAIGSGAEAIHPGYGFLSENVEFAEACLAAGITFIGPPPAAIRAMGLKDAAKQLMRDAGVPVVPGYWGERQDPEFLLTKAGEIGYPVLIKAVAGGGGKGMRLINRADDFIPELEACRREAAGAFGDPRVMIERYVTAPRHIEFQVFADSHGNVVHLFERDCSLQRRHQKVIEEAPAAGMTAECRREMGNAAVLAARAVGYVGAGTVEFIVDAGSFAPDSFFFMEMNTRLQVEHPVTEAVTGLDLVEWQFRVAAGEALDFKQDDLRLAGHAIEARLYAEDPASGFLPQSGTLHRLVWPAAMPDLRIDTGVEQGDNITAFYDPMIAKLIVHAQTRQAALRTLAEALDQTILLGIRSNRQFLSKLCQAPGLIDGPVDTSFIGDQLRTLVSAELSPLLLIAGVEAWLALKTRPTHKDPWSALSGWAFAGMPRRDCAYLVINGENARADITWIGPDRRHHRLYYGQRVIEQVVGDVVCDDWQLSFTGPQGRVRVDLASADGRIYSLPPKVMLRSPIRI